MTFVVDASIVLAGVLPDGTSERADSLIVQLQRDNAVVPCVWALEVANALAIAARRGRISLEKSERIVQVVLELPIDVEYESPEDVLTVALALAQVRNLSVYDASYLELAIRRGFPLTTLDARVRQAATSVGIPLL